MWWHLWVSLSTSFWRGDNLLRSSKDRMMILICLQVLHFSVSIVRPFHFDSWLWWTIGSNFRIFLSSMVHFYKTRCTTRSDIGNHNDWNIQVKQWFVLMHLLLVRLSFNHSAILAHCIPLVIIDDQNLFHILQCDSETDQNKFCCS